MKGFATPCCTMFAPLYVEAILIENRIINIKQLLRLHIGFTKLGENGYAGGSVVFMRSPVLPGMSTQRHDGAVAALGCAFAGTCESK